MCNFLYCCIAKEANDDLFRDICKKFGYTTDITFALDYMLFNPGIKNGFYLRVTNNMCDCGTVLGGSDANAEELHDYIKWLKELRKCQKHGMGAFNIMKFWEGSDHEKELKPMVTVNIDDVDAPFLATI